MRSRDRSGMHGAANRLDIEEREVRLDLLRKAQAGEAGALCVLHARYGLRLPLVEARLGLPFPWMVPRTLKHEMPPKRLASRRGARGTRRGRRRPGRARGGFPRGGRLC